MFEQGKEKTGSERASEARNDDREERQGKLLVCVGGRVFGINRNFGEAKK